MIKLLRLFKRAPRCSTGEFLTAWQEDYAAAVSAAPPELPTLRRYVRNPALTSDSSGDESALDRVAERWFDGVEELWFDEVADLETWRNHVYVEEELEPLEQKFLDRDGCEEYVTQDVHMDEKPTRPGTVKLFGLLAPREDIEPPEFHEYWQYHHGPLAMNTDSWEPHAGHYVQSHVMEEAHEEEPFYLGIAIVWFADLGTFTNWLESPDLPEVIFPDEENFLNRDELKMVLTREEEVL